MRRILVVDDEENLRLVLRTLLRRNGYEVETASSGEEALGLVESFGPDVVITDVRMPRMGGMDLLGTLRAKGNDATVIVMSAYGNLDQAIDAIKAGAYDYIQKPFKPDEVVLALRKAEERESLRRENRVLREEIRREHRFEDILAKSAVMQGVFRTIAKIANYKTTVLITGESGVGKEVVARTVHGRSGRSEQPFIAVNCAAIPDTLIESELFGHVRGAFTGADSDKPGLFREADGGTLFLDEVGELPPAVQVKLLRVLQEEEVRPVGEPKAVRVDVRILAATARDLEGEVATGRFREDLYYRLNVFRIAVPPLRERPEDIPALADALLESLARRIGKPVQPLDGDVLAKLCAHDWPGNVRELRNTLERALILARGSHIGAELFAVAAAPAVDVPGVRGGDESDLSIKRGTRELEERLIRRALEATHGNRARAAELLEISPRALQYKIKEYGLAGLNPAGESTDSAGAGPRPGSRQ
ncbi:MAG TPA: sigma-54 dependent transcriptional regulator [Polyangiaceae bacterium]